MRISDWSSDVCSSDLLVPPAEELPGPVDRRVERYCPRGTKLCLIAQHRSSPLSSRPQPQNDNGEYDENLADEQLGWGHVGLLATGAEARLRLLALLSVHSLPLTMCPPCASLRRAQTFRRIDRKSDVEGTSVSVGVNLGVRRIINNNKQ